MNLVISGLVALAVLAIVVMVWRGGGGPPPPGVTGGAPGHGPPATDGRPRRRPGRSTPRGWSPGDAGSSSDGGGGGGGGCDGGGGGGG